MCSSDLSLRLRTTQKTIHALLKVFLMDLVYSLRNKNSEFAVDCWRLMPVRISEEFQKLRRVCWMLPVSHDQDNSGRTAWKTDVFREISRNYWFHDSL